MGLMDNLKQGANNLAASVNDTVSKGQQSMDQSASRKHSDALLRDLGALVYARDSGRGTASTDGDIDRLTADLRAHEAQGGLVDLAPKAGVPAPPPGSAAAPPAPGAASPPPPPGGVAPPPAPGQAATPPPPAPAATPPAPAAPSQVTTPPPPPPGTVAPPPPPGTVGS